jgi:hypothetical protein
LLLIPVRVDPASPASLALGVGFAARANVRLILVPNISANPANWDVLLAAAGQFPGQLFIVPADEPMPADKAATTWKRARELPNVIVVAGERSASGSDNRDKDSWRSFLHIGPCGNAVHHLQQNDRPLALGALAHMAAIAAAAQREEAQISPTGAALKQALLARLADDLAKTAATPDKSMKTWVGSGLAKQILADTASDPARSGWRLVTGCTLF